VNPRKRNNFENKGKRPDRAEIERLRKEEAISSWIPKTELGKRVKSGEIKNIDQILDKGIKILEPIIVDMLLPNLESELITIGQAKGKFGGGKRSIWKQTQKKTGKGNKPKFATVALIGTKDGYVGLGHGSSRERVPGREKAVRRAKLNIIKIRRGCGSWSCACGENHSIPFEIVGKCSSVKVKLMPAPKGTNLTAHKEIQKILRFAGIKDVYSKTFGQTKTQLNLVKACMDALQQLNAIKVKPSYFKRSGLTEGKNDKNNNS
jgi:small subunit ribosomal protein S5